MSKATIAGTAVFIPDIEVFWNQHGCISIQQAPDPSYEDSPNIVIVDRERVKALIHALRDAMKAEGE